MHPSFTVPLALSVLGCVEETQLPTPVPTSVTYDSDPAATAPTDPCAFAITPLAADEAGSEGESAQQRLEPWLAARDATFVYRDATTTVVRLALEILSVEETLPAEGETRPECTAPGLVADLQVSLTTDDGAFDLVTREPVAAAADLTSLFIGPYASPAEQAGSYDDPPWDLMSIVANLLPDGWSGELVAVRGVDECGIGAWNGDLMTGCAE